MRRTATWLVLAAVAVVVIVGVVDAVRRSPSDAESAGGNVFTIDGITITAPSAQVSTEGVATTAAVTTTEPLETNPAQIVESAPPERLPPCKREQLKLSVRVEEDTAEFALRRVDGPPCHQRSLYVDLTVLDESGREVPVSTSNFYWQRHTPAADFADRFVQVIKNPFIAVCEPHGRFIAIPHIGPYMARRTVSAKEIRCEL
jgi:hypothetical protein